MGINIQQEINNKEINIPKLEAKNNKNSFKLQEKIQSMKKMLKKVWNNPYVKASTVAVGTLSTTGASKLIYDAVKNNKTVDEINLTPADVAWIKKNMILFAQEFPFCWHNVFMQLLACPEYIYYSNLPNHPIRKSKKIMTMINFAKSELNKKFTGNFLKRKIEVPLEIRQMPDDIILRRGTNNKWVPEDNTLSDKFKKCVIIYANHMRNLYVEYDEKLEKDFLNCNPNKNEVVDKNKKFKGIKIPNNVILKWDDTERKFVPEDDSLDNNTKEYVTELANYQIYDNIVKNSKGKFILNYEPNKTWLTDNGKHSFVLSNLEYICDGNYRFDNIGFNELGILDVPDTEYCDSDEILEHVDDEVYYAKKPINEVSAAKVLEARRNNDVNKVYGWTSYEGKEDAMKYYTRRAENILMRYGRETHNEIPAKDINCCQKYGYYPTFVVIFDKVDYSGCPHYHCCLIVYDENKNIKYFLWGDGIKDGFRIMTANKSLEKLNKYSNILVKYSRSDVVEKFYTIYK